MEQKFGMRRTHIASTLDTMTNALYLLARQYLSNPSIFHDRMPYYANLVEHKCFGLLSNVWGFIDGRVRKTCRPFYFQKHCYSGHKRYHGLKYQSMYIPDGLFAHLYGPIYGNRHNSFMIQESGFLQAMQRME